MHSVVERFTYESIRSFFYQVTVVIDPPRFLGNTENRTTFNVRQETTVKHYIEEEIASESVRCVNITSMNSEEEVVGTNGVILVQLQCL